MSVNNNPIEGVESKKQYSRPYNSNTKKYDNILNIKSRIDKNSVIGKSWIANNLIDNADGSVSFEEELNEKGEPTGYLTTTFERNLNEVGENGLGLIVKIQPQGAENTLANAGFINPKTAQATGEGFVTSKINGARTLDNGIRVTTSETHFNAKALENNQAYVADNKKIAAGITALPLDQQVKYMANNLGWGNLGEKEWAKMTDVQKSTMITNSLREDDLRKMLKGDPNKNPIMSRAATSNDVALYAVDKQIINEGDTIYFTETMRKADKLQETGAKSLTPAQLIAKKKEDERTEQNTSSMNAASEKGVNLITDTNSSLKNMNFGGNAKNIIKDSKISKDGELTIAYYTGTITKKRGKAGRRDLSKATFNLFNDNELQTLAFKFYPGKDNAKNREAFKKSIKKELEASKTKPEVSEEEENNAYLKKMMKTRAEMMDKAKSKGTLVYNPVTGKNE